MATVPLIMLDAAYVFQLINSHAIISNMESVTETLPSSLDILNGANEWDNSISRGS